MARVVTRRGRMRSEDEQRIQANIVFIEQEVDGADLAPSLYAAQILDNNDKDEIMGGKTRMDRTRLLINILLLRGPNAFEEFLQVLEANGYDHVAFRLRNTISPGTSTPLPSRTADIEITSQRMTHTSSGYTSMFCRMRDSCSRENLLELARCVSAPDCVFLTSSGTAESLHKETAADCPPAGADADHGPRPTRHQQKDMADGNEMNTGHVTGSASYRPSVKVGGAKENEPQRNVTQRQRNTSVTSMSRDSDDGVAVSREPRSSLSEEEGRGGKTMDERLRRIEDAWFILSRRITRVEDRVTSSTNIPEEELHLLKEELNDLKTDTIQQVLELTEENERKALIIEKLTSEAVERKARLVEAQERIESLSKRILCLETEKGRAEEDVKALKGQLRENERQIVEQNEHFSKETLRLRNQVLEQNKRMKEQEAGLSELQEKEREHRKRSEEQEDELRDQRLSMDEQMHQLGLLAQVVHGMAQTGTVHSPANSNTNPMFCISNTLGSSKNTLGNSSTSGSRNTARSVKRSAPAPIYRGFRRK